MILFPLFYRKYVLRRLMDLTTLHDISELKELPVGSMLHIFNDNFKMDKPIVFVPDVADNPMMNLEPIYKFVYHVSSPVSGVIPFKESFVLPSQGVTTTILNFKKANQKFMRPVMKVEMFPTVTRPNVQSLISYNSLYRARVFGLIRLFRRMNYVLTSVLNQVCSMPDRNHFIPIPVGNRTFARNDFMKSLIVHDRTSIRYSDDPWYIFMVHLMGFLNSTPTPSLFEKIPKEMLPKIFFILYTNRSFMILDLAKLKEFNGANNIIYLRFLNVMNKLAGTGFETPVAIVDDSNVKYDTMEDKTLPDVDTDTPFDTGEKKEESKYEEKPVVQQSLFPSSKPVEPPPPAPKIEETPKPVPPPPEPKKEEVKPKKEEKIDPPLPTSKPVEPVKPKPVVAPSVKVAPPKPVVQQTVPKKEPPPQVDDLPTLDIPVVEVDPKLLEIPPETQQNIAEFTKPITKEEQKKFNTDFVKEIDREAKIVIENNTELTDAQKKRVTAFSNNYKSIKVGTQTIEQILQSVPDDTVSTNKLDFLEDAVEDKSMLKSSVQTFEHDYIAKDIFKRDLISELVSFNKQGMFLQQLEVKDASDSLNKAETFVAKYKDIHQKDHTIRFTIPKVDERGYCYINGTLKTLKKQRVPNPIVKVSPTRVTLNSDYNKYLVERNTSVAHSFIYYVDKIIEKAAPNTVSVVMNSYDYRDIMLPYEYTTCARKYRNIVLKLDNDNYHLFFDYHNKQAYIDENVPTNATRLEALFSIEKDTNTTVFMVSKNGEAGFIRNNGEVLVYRLNDETLVEKTTIIDFLCDKLQVELTDFSEWVDFKLLNKSIPVIFALCYRYGLSHMLQYTKTKYTIYEKGTRLTNRKQSDIVVRFADKTMVIPRVPFVNSLLFAGLNMFSYKNVNMDELDSKDVYYDLIQSKKISVHNLKGIDNYFDLFVDPITKDVLNQMGEPTNAKDLLIRATQLLTTEDHKPAASSSNFRFRSYERINSAVYKVMSRAYATYKHKAIGASNKFSIADYEIKQLIMQDQLMENVDIINPINDIKYQCEFSHAGFGGRQSIDTFMVEDRQFPDDGVGIISEATVDSSKTAYAASTSMNPTIVNMRGMTVTKDKEQLEPAEILSVASLLAPCVTQDDGKRMNFVSIHLSHYLPTIKGHVSRVRTGYEKVVAHRTRPPFAYAAEEDGTIESIDNDAQVLVVKYKSGKSTAVKFGEEYTNNGGGGFYCTQNIAVNNFKAGDKVKRGDVIVYNDRFFTPDPFSKQVDWNIGVLTNVVLIDNDGTHEDGSVISEHVAEDLEFDPVHVRDIILTKGTNVHKYAAVGTKVLNTDPLLIFDQSAITDDMFGKLDEESVDLLTKLNRKTPRAKFSGKIVKIDIFYKCPATELSDSLKGLVGVVYKEKNKQHKAAAGTHNAEDFVPDLQIKYTDRLGMVDLDNDTVIIRFYIQQNMSMNAGDKIEFDSSLKSVATKISKPRWETEDGSVICDALFSSIGISNRIVASPIITGIANRILEKLQSDVVKMYFG